MHLSEIIADWRRGDLVFIKSSVIAPALMKLTTIATLSMMAMPAPAYADNINVDKTTIQTIKNVISKKNIDYHVELSGSKLSNSDVFFDKHDIAVECSITVNPDELSRNLSTKYKAVTKNELAELIYYHEQAHCADYASMFGGMQDYKQAESDARDKDEYAEAILNESFADSFALLMMAATHPEKANLYFNYVYDNRLYESDEASAGNVEPNHDTKIAIMQTASAWNKVDIRKVQTLMSDPIGKASLEQEFASIASVSAMNALKRYLSNAHIPVNEAKRAKSISM